VLAEQNQNGNHCLTLIKGEVKVRSQRKWLILALTIVLILATSLLPVVTTSAYGNNALWQIGLSFNCNNPSLCLTPPFGIGGFWGWIEFDSDGTGDATLTGCSHLSTSLGVLTGADHLQVEITAWTIAPGSAGPATFFITDGTVSFTGVNTRGAPVTVPLSVLGVLDTGVPAAAGHYSFSSLMGFTAPPGVNFQIQVAQLPH
jgi:hypothetical protein